MRPPTLKFQIIFHLAPPLQILELPSGALGHSGLDVLILRPGLIELPRLSILSKFLALTGQPVSSFYMLIPEFIGVWPCGLWLSPSEQNQGDLPFGKYHFMIINMHWSTMNYFVPVFSTLPGILVSSTSYIQYLSFYRQFLSDALLSDCIDLQSTGALNISHERSDVSHTADEQVHMRGGWSCSLLNSVIFRSRNFLCCILYISHSVVV